MSFRTASTTQQRQSLLDLQRTQERLAQNTARVTSGNRLTGPGDDPTATAAILDFNNSIQANTQSMKQADSALNLLKSSEDAVSGAIDSMMRLKELAVNGSSASGPELDAIRQNLLALANTQFQGKYLFAGTKTQTQPFTDGATVAWNGNQSDIALSVSTTTSITTNVTGDEVFLGGKGKSPDIAGSNPNDIFQAVTDLKAALTTGTGVQAVSTRLDNIFQNLNATLATLGGRQAGLISLKDTLSNFNATLEGLQSAQEATDYPKAATELASDQTLQTATLSTMAKTNKVSLFDYLT
jgi:flagellar hook-associated protein 3 FlgL